METTNNTSFAEEHPFATELGKNAAGAAATAVGLAVGSYLIGTAKGYFEARKMAKVNPTDETTEE